MDTFFTWEYLLSFAGCVAATGIITQLLKNIFDKLPTQVVSYVIALAVLLVGQAATGKLNTWDVAVLDAVNAVVVSLAANGGFDAVKRIFVPKTDAETEFKDEGDE